ncbi:DNA methyltransferase [Peribacillus frigoritolerans]|uniref:DNA methyltransferase n=1 Tax=Peribacillus castrilensis TaxID=2897690 RepID=UPI003DA2E12B
MKAIKVNYLSKSKASYSPRKNPYNNKGETKLDCFMGSGSTGQAAKNQNRNFIDIGVPILYCACISHFYLWFIHS